MERPRHRAVGAAARRERPGGIAADACARAPCRLRAGRCLAAGRARSGSPATSSRSSWRARLSEQLGNYSGELREPHAARALDDASELAGLSAACALIDAALPEREPHPAIFDGFRALLGALGHPGWPVIYVRLELGLLQELGFGLDLDEVRGNGRHGGSGLRLAQDRPGGVSRGRRTLQEKLIDLPAFLSTGGLPADDEQSCGKASI